MSPKAKAVSALTLRKRLHSHLTAIGFTKNCTGYYVDGDLTKDRVRTLHASQRQQILDSNVPFIEEHGADLVESFATGKSVDPAAIDPELVEVSPDTRESRLFRFATLLWSVPVSQGFGRRLRYLVRDRQNGCLIGLFAIGDPVFNLSARDQWIGWSHTDRMERLTHVMDAYVAGSVPPYSGLICGKLVAALIGSLEIKKAYEKKYLGTSGVISERENRSRLVLVTTTSALGRSAMYNRLSIPNGPRFERIGTTKGFGHFHLTGEVFELMRRLLEDKGHPYASGHRFGMGPNWKIRVARAALDEIGLDSNAILKHGIEREVYAMPLAHNWKQILLGQQQNVRSTVLPAAHITDYCRNRWIVPRSQRDKSYKRFARCRIMEALGR